MKLKLLVAFLATYIGAIAQNPSNYPYRATRERLIAVLPDSTSHIAAGPYASLRTGGSTRAGALFADTVGTDKGIKYWMDGVFNKLIDSAAAGGGIIDSIWREAGKDSIKWRRNGTLFIIKDSTGGSGGLAGGNLGSSLRLYSPGSQGIKSIATPNSVKGDSVTSNTITLQLDGDQSAPGPYYNYGTNGSGTKGYYRGAALDTSQRIDGWVVRWNNTSGMLEFRPPFDTSGTGTITGSGTSGRGAYWNGSSSLSSSANWTFDGTTHTVANSSTAPSILSGNIALQSLGTNNNIVGFNTYYASGFKAVATGRTSGIYGPNGELQFFTSSSNSSAGAAAAWVARMKIAEAGNIAIGPNVASSTPTAYLHLSNGTTSAGTAPLKYTSGSLNTTPEAGAKEYNNAHYETTNALNRLGLAGVIFSNSSSVSNSTTTVTTLSTYTTKANTLAATEEKLIFEYEGTVDDASPIDLQVSFAGQTIGSFAPAGGGMSWHITGKIVRTGSATATAYVQMTSSTTTVTNAIVKLTGLTFSGTNILLLTGQSDTGATDDIVKELAEIYWVPASAN